MATTRSITRNKPVSGTNSRTVKRPAQTVSVNSTTASGRRITTTPAYLTPPQRINVPDVEHYSVDQQDTPRGYAS